MSALILSACIAAVPILGLLIAFAIYVLILCWRHA